MLRQLTTNLHIELIPNATNNYAYVHQLTYSQTYT